MRTMRQLSALFLGLMLSVASIKSAGFVYEMRFEFVATGDLDGDGRDDIVVVDRPSGVFRVGYQTAADTYTWSDARSTGIDAAEAVSLGRLVSSSRDSLLIASGTANRVNLCDVTTSTSPTIPQSIYVGGVGPGMVLSVDIAGPGNTGLDDLVVGTDLNGPPSNVLRSLVRNTAGTFSVLSETTPAGALHAGNRLRLKAAGVEMAGFLSKGVANDAFAVVNYTVSPSTLVLNFGLPVADARWLSGFFSGSPLAVLGFYQVGQSNLVCVTLSEPLPGVFSPVTTNSYNLGNSIESVQVVSSPAGARLVVLFSLGATGAVYDFDGVSAPVLLQTLTPDSGQSFTAAAITGNNQFQMLSGDGLRNRSSQWQKFSFSGGQFVGGAKGTLPALHRAGSRANVFLFANEPFVSLQPNLIRSLQAGDWTANFAKIGAAPGTVQVQASTYLGQAQGLGSPQAVSLGSVPLGGPFGLVNQFAPSISVFSRSAAIGDEVADIRISPESGLYQKAVMVTLQSPVAGVAIKYRIGAGTAWQTYSTPFFVFKRSIVSYYAQPFGSNAKSVIHSAEYQFYDDPATIDSDKDGIPDYVELGLGLNPLGGKDKDGDGFTDLNELVAGTDLTSTNLPWPTLRLEDKSAFDLLSTPRPYDGTVPVQTLAGVGVAVRAYDLSGSLLREEVTRNLGLPGITDPASRLTNISVDLKQRLVVVTTEPHFDLTTLGADKKLGRELVRLVPVPTPQAVVVPDTYNLALTPFQQASNWVLAAQSAYLAQSRERITNDIDVLDTLATLLFERKIAGLLWDRGNTNADHLTLLSYRANDAGRYTPSSKELLDLEKRLDDTHPGFLLQPTASFIENAVAAAAMPGLVDLNNVAWEIYRISSASNNAAPGKYPYPLDVLRTFIADGTLHSNYLAVTSLSAGVLASAQAGASNLLQSVIPRPTVVVNLAVRNDTFGRPCTILDTVPASSQRALYHPDSISFRLLESFNLPVGSIVHVFGYNDLGVGGCGAEGIEVISLALNSAPVPSLVDSDGDLMLDALELLYFGSLGGNGSGDSDGDGFSDLQELLDGTNPIDVLNHGLTVVNLAPPELIMMMSPVDGSFTITFNWPSAYAGKIKFGIQSQTDLGGFVSTELLPAVQLGPDLFGITVPAPATQTKFYLVTLSLPGS